nr:hypothetical protein Itr_chr10CG00420 [Ipomoea trifida]GMD39513.1 hypothetical protein Iba_chr10aCG0470 [Ipomoea batatas]GMD41566.1 hypothetical protein Iba_chr10bCG0930 [Ipomoea batatas]GMD46150.1 hypothetical protein Iba_chr10eCG0550 [Ipomoea batatas]GME17565.1 hypothetical protein Iba_scaffold18996CG0010 [Ipomoea batatas]
MATKILFFTLLLLWVTVDLGGATSRGMVATAERRSEVSVTEAGGSLGHSGYGEQEPEINNHHNIPRDSWPENGQTPTSPAAFKTTTGENNG